MMNPAATFDDAFQILDQAMMAQPLPQFGSLARTEFEFFKDAVKQESSASLAELSRGGGELMLLAREISVMSAEQSAAFANEAVKKFDEQLRENPALMIGGVALAGFAFGLLASASRAQQKKAQI